MKRLIYTVAFTLTCVSSAPASLVGLPMNSTAFAAESSCLSINSGTTTGGAAREQLEAIARCHSLRQPSIVIGEQTKNVLPDVQNMHERSKPSFCETNLNSHTSGSGIRDQLRAIARCNSLSQLSDTQEPSFNQSKSILPRESKPTLQGLDAKVDNTYPAYCPALPGGLKARDFGFREALARCLYGS